MADFDMWDLAMLCVVVGWLLRGLVWDSR